RTNERLQHEPAHLAGGRLAVAIQHDDRPRNASWTQSAAVSAEHVTTRRHVVAWEAGYRSLVAPRDRGSLTHVRPHASPATHRTAPGTRRRGQDARRGPAAPSGG